MAITDLEMADLVREVCYDMGAGPLVLGGPLSGYRAFADAVGEGAQFPYMIVSIADPAQWEAGTGALDESGKLARSPVSSSAGGAAVDFGAGEKRIGLALHSGWAEAVEAHGHAISGVSGLMAALAGKQGAHANLAAIAAQASAADQLSYWTGAGTAGLTALGALGRGLIGAADAAAARTSLGLAIGGDVQAHNVQLDAIAALTTTAFGRGALTSADAAAFRGHIGAGTSSTTGTVTSVSAGSGLSFADITGAGSVTLGTPASTTLSSANGVTTASHTHAFVPGGTTTQYIRGDGTLANLPTFTPAALSKTDDTNVTLTLGGTPATAMLQATSIAVAWSGQLAADRGGTGAASLTGYVKGNGTAAMTASSTIPATDVSGDISGNAVNVTGMVAVSNGGTGAVTASVARSNLGLGTAATVNTGTSGATIPLLSAANIWTQAQTFQADALIDAAAGTSRYYRLYAGGLDRWRIGRNATSESGSNAGSDFVITRYSDTGTLLGTAMSINRATGAVTLGVDLPITEGGTGASDAAGARTNLGLGTIATQASSAVAITGGTVAGLTSQIIGGTALVTTMVAGNPATPNEQTLATGAAASKLIARFTNDANSSRMFLLKTRGSSVGVFAATLSGDTLGEISFGGSGASAAVEAARIRVVQTGSSGASYAPARMDFLVSEGTTVNVPLLLNPTGATPGTDNIFSLGSASLRWSVVYAATGTINTSDARLKRDVGGVEDGLLDAWSEVTWSRYRFVDAWEAKGEGARWHMGLIAQEVRDAIDARMGDGAAVRLGLVCHDQWDALDEQRDGEGHVIHPGRVAGDRWGLRYEECLAVEAAWQRRRMGRIEARIDALEARDVAG